MPTPATPHPAARHRTPALAAILALVAALAAAAPARAADPLDLSGVRRIEISGGSAALTVTADAGRPFAGSIGAVATGWFGWRSSWFFDDCAAASTLSLSGTTLTVHTVSSRWYSLSECQPDVVLNVPPGADIEIDQAAAWVRLDGDFGRLAARGSAMELSLDGHAGTVRLDGHAMHVRLTYTSISAGEDIAIAGNAVLADVEFGSGVPVSYTVTGKADFVDSRLPNTPGAPTKVAISGDFVRATIR